MTLKTKEEIEIVGRERLTPALDLAKKYVSKSFARPVLTMVNLTPNGNLQATDSHKMVIFKDVHSYKENVCINLNTLNIERGWNYPSLSGLATPSTEVKGVAEFKRNYMKELLATLKFFNSKTITGVLNAAVKITITKGEIRFKSFVFETTIRSEEFHTTENVEPIVFSINPSYLVDVFETFLKYSNHESIQMKFYGRMKILIFENDEFVIGVLPVRTYEPGENNG